ncbi:MAG: hypothetical protein FJY77_01960 [Candidatus Altiarchaeales archaeon]|nr:hypothetical protein [Candidatus Altiarchaeales archaeon]
MPYEYNIPQLMRFLNAYEYFGILLRVFSQPYTCEIMSELIKSKEITVAEIRSKLGAKAPNFLVSKTLTQLKNRRIVGKTGNLYTLKNPHFHNKLKQVTEQIKNLVEAKSPQEITCDDIRSVAEALNHIFFDNTSNILIHILLKRDLSFNEIVNTFRSNHGYIARVKLRYHLKSRKIKICGKDLAIFATKAKRYSLTTKGKKLHEILDTFLVEYEAGAEEWIKNVWNQPLNSMVDEQVPMVYLRDPVHKIIKILEESNAAIVFSNEVDGIITIKQLMNKIGECMSSGGFIVGITAKDVMTPVTANQIIPGETTLARLYAKEKGFKHRQYIVSTGVETYSILDLKQIVKKINEV